MVSASIKVLIGLGVAGAVGGGGYGIYMVSRPGETVLDALNNKKLTILDTEGAKDNNEWDKKITEHKSATEDTPKLFGYKEQTGDNAGEKNRKSMQSLCKGLFKSLSKDGNKLQQAEKWCVKISS